MTSLTYFDNPFTVDDSLAYWLVLMGGGGGIDSAVLCPPCQDFIQKNFLCS